jgi:hypothetical protein
MASVEELLQHGIAAAKAKRKAEAERLLRQVVQYEPENEMAWLWLSAVVVGIDRQRESLFRVLRINPNNSFARHGLAFLSRLRSGEEWRAAEAPWMEGLHSEVVERVEVPGVRCPECGTPNPASTSICSHCGSALQPPEVEEPALEESVPERPPSARPDINTSVMRSWAGALTLQGAQLFAPEIPLSNVGRSLTALFLGMLMLVLARLVVAMLPVIRGWQDFEVFLGRIGLPLLEEMGLILTASILVYLLLAALTFLPARLLGGRGGLNVHFHLIAIAISSWFVVATLGFLIAWLPVLIATPSVQEALRPWLVPLVAGVLLIYALFLLAGALRAAHGISLVKALLIEVVLGVAGVALYLFLAPGLPHLRELARAALPALRSVLFLPFSG